MVVNQLKVNNTMHQQCGKNSLSRVTLAQSDRVSLWLWSMADNPNPSNLGAQDNKALILEGFHPSSYPISLGASYCLSPRIFYEGLEGPLVSSNVLTHVRCGLHALGNPSKGFQKVLFEFGLRLS